jgi:hypothetical protein
VLPRDCFGDAGAHRWLAVQPLRATLRAAARLDAPGAPRAPPWRTTATLALQLLDVLSHVHAAGWVHGDVNADNIMLGGAQPAAGRNAPLPGALTHAGRGRGPRTGAAPPLDAAGERAYLIDFGCARPFAGVGAAGAAPQAAALGTPLYAATSFARGAPLSPRDDLESLGYLLLAVAGGGRAALPWGAAADAAAVDAAKLAAAPAALARGARAPAARAALAVYFAALAAVTPADALAPAGLDYAALKAIFAPHAAPDGRLEWDGGAAEAAGGGGGGGGAAAAAAAQAQAPAAAVPAARARKARSPKAARGSASPQKKKKARTGASPKAAKSPRAKRGAAAVAPAAPPAPPAPPAPSPPASAPKRTVRDMLLGGLTRFFYSD